ncbi:hypothetical protein SAMD00023353_5800400 [Rosellinia necatrix]|uniref:Uncharacterized protein n=1 Tax=Rosellinia necatrix TaxID=77044 RepID=A0A1S8AB68_ROSNE|nr:hypothetical protein SAMD00023353_5800400 [Rosellinia necatrix]
MVAAAPITSFPKLISRSCTNDWLTPLGLFNEVENGVGNGVENGESDGRQPVIANLYKYGVDAHSGVPVYNRLPSVEEDPPITSPLPDDLLPQHYDSFIRGYEDSLPAKIHEMDEHHERKLGQSIGAAAHRRIKVREHDRNQDVREGLLEGLQHYSFLPILDQTTEHTCGERTVQPVSKGAPEPEKEERKRPSLELLERILHQSNRSSKGSTRSKSSSGIWEATRSQEYFEQESKQKGWSCSEETRPHACTDERRVQGA